MKLEMNWFDSMMLLMKYFYVFLSAHDIYFADYLTALIYTYGFDFSVPMGLVNAHKADVMDYLWCSINPFKVNESPYFATPIIEMMYNVHREYYIILTAIFVIILYVLYIELVNFRDIEYRYSVNNQFELELAWSIVPALIILHFMVMTIALLYCSDEHTFFGFQVKVIGHQWYWEYDIVKCFSNVESLYTYMSDSVIPELKLIDSWEEGSDGLYKHELEINSLPYCSERLLDTEGVLYVPYRTHVRLLVTSFDVIHSFTIPGLGIKADGIPGRLNDLHFFLTDNTSMIHYFGQCSELCGVGHAFMPIHMVSI